MRFQGIYGVRELLEHFEKKYLESKADAILKLDEDIRSRVRKALEYRGRVKLVRCRVDRRITWLIIGPDTVHYIIPKTYCSCKDYNVNVIHREVKRPCYHMILQVIANAEGDYLDVELKPEILEEILDEVEELEDSETLRRIIERESG